MTDDQRRDVLAERLAAVGTRPGFAELPAWTRWTRLADAALSFCAGHSISEGYGQQPGVSDR
jgi:hypothetical protein